MTRQHNNQYHCPNCHTWVTAETSFGRWIRNNKELDSVQGYCVVDQDYWILKFKTHGNRGFQCLMCVEIKTMGANLTDAQRDLLYIINQFLRNRNGTPTKTKKHQPAGRFKVYSPMNGCKIEARGYGMHVLRFSKLGPADSDDIWWDSHRITERLLTRILRFDVDPDTLLDIDFRNHHRTHATQTKILDL